MLILQPRGSSFLLARTKFDVPFNFPGAATNITTLVAAPIAFFTDAGWDTREGAFASAVTSCAGSRSLAVTFRTQKPVWHLTHTRLFSTNVPSQRPQREGVA
jgi:hypothetical protein